MVAEIFENFEVSDGISSNTEQASEQARQRNEQAKKTWIKGKKQEQRFRKDDVDLAHFLLNLLQSENDLDVLSLVVSLLEKGVAASVLVVVLLLVYDQELGETLKNKENYQLLGARGQELLVRQVAMAEKKVLKINKIPVDLQELINFWLADIVIVAKDFEQEQRGFLLKDEIINPLLLSLFMLLVARKMAQFGIDVVSNKSHVGIRNFCKFVILRLVEDLK